MLRGFITEKKRLHGEKFYHGEIVMILRVNLFLFHMRKVVYASLPMKNILW